MELVYVSSGQAGRESKRHIMSEPWNTPDRRYRSECCDALPIDEVDEYQLGFCSECKEHAVFYEEEE